MLAASLIAGCGGGATSGGNVATLPQTPTQLPQAESVAFRIVIPQKQSSARRAKYISASTQSASIAVGSATPLVVNCTTVCSGTVNAPVGSDTFTVKLYDALNGGGKLLSTGSATQTINAGQANSINLTFNGAVASLAVTLSANAIAAGTSGSATVTVTARDADGNTIVAPGGYVNSIGNPVTVMLADSDTTGSSLSATSFAQPPASAITLNYTSSLATSPTVTASVTGITNATATAQLVHTPTLTNMTMWSGQNGSTLTETLTGTNFVAGVTAVAVSGTNVTVNSVNVTSATTLTVNFVIAPAATFLTQDVTVSNLSLKSGAAPFSVANGPAYPVTSNADSGPGTLRQAMINANSVSGALILFACGNPCTITLASPLPPITTNTIIDGGTYGSVIIDGASLYRAFWADRGSVVLANLEIQNAKAQGGNGGTGILGGAGGGLGAGAGLFIRAAAVSVVNDFFNNDAAEGGNGGAGRADGLSVGGGGGGGGGLGGNGGNGAAGTGSVGGAGNGGGGGGVTGAGGSALYGSGRSGGYGGAGGGGGGGLSGTGGAGYAGASAGIQATSDGGGGGFGGGGGGAGTPTGLLGFGGAGGFGGGAGSGNTNCHGGGVAGPGGGGAGDFCTGSSGGQLGAGVGGGAGATVANSTITAAGGGGGAAAGPAIFVYGGTLTTFNSGAIGSVAITGAGGLGTTIGSPGTMDPTPVFNYAGTVNGIAVTAGNGGPVSTALGSSIP